MPLNMKPKVSQREANELAERMSNWDELHASFEKEPATLELVEKMLHVELTTKKRLTLTTRLLGIYNNLERQENERRVRQALADED